MADVAGSVPPSSGGRLAGSEAVRSTYSSGQEDVKLGLSFESTRTPDTPQAPTQASAACLGLCCRGAPPAANHPPPRWSVVDSRASQSTAARLTAPRAARQAERRGGGRSDVRAQWRDGAGESGCGSRAAPARWHLQALAELGGEGRAGRQRQPTGRSDAARRELRQCTAAREPACMKRGAPNGLEAANAQWDGRFRSDLEEEMRSRRRARDGRRSQNPPGSLPQDDQNRTAGGLWRGVRCCVSTARESLTPK